MLKWIVLALAILALIAWLLTRGAKGSQPAAELRNAYSDMERADQLGDLEAKKAAARRILEIIEKYGLSGSFSDQAKQAAEAALAQ